MKFYKALVIFYIAWFFVISCGSRQKDIKSQVPDQSEKQNIINQSNVILTDKNLLKQPVNKVINKPIIKKNELNNPNTPKQLTKADFLKNVMDYEKNPNQWIYKGNLPCIIDFYADWCAPCRMTAPILEELAKEYTGKIIFYKVNTQYERELAGIFNIQSIPTFLFCPSKGNPTISSGIASTKEQTKAMFKQMIDQYLFTK